MWFIKTEFLDEFKAIINSYQNELDIVRKVQVIKEIENFCKQGKGISFYNKNVINSKLLNEIEKYKNDINYCLYSTKEI